MKRQWIVYMLIAMLGLGLFSSAGICQVGAAPDSFDPNQVLCNSDFVVDRAVNAEEVQGLLEAADADLSTYRDPTNNLLASEIVASAIEANLINGRYRLNPQLLLVKMEVESSTVWGGHRHHLDDSVSLQGTIVGTRVDWILFYGWPDDPNRVDLSKKGFTNQVNNAARILASDFADVLEDDMGRNGWGIGVSKQVDGIPVTPVNAATVALYIYTPHVYPDKENIYNVWTQRIGMTGCRDELDGSPPTSSTSATVLVVDVSGSMGENWQGGIKIESAKAAAVDVINMVELDSQIGASNHQVAIATFTSNAHLDLGLTTDYNVARQVVNGLMPQQRTNIGAGLQVSNQALTSAPAGSQKIIILLSDGLTNEGLTRQRILDGPVRDAAAAGTCIYTVGFGDRGELDEVLLQEIATGSGCGEYNYASAPTRLRPLYHTLRHQSLGQIRGTFQGQVSQGQQVNAGQVDVPSGQDALYASLYWPGSVLGLVLTDPQGQAVDENYPGAVISTYPQLVYAIVDDPLAGTWSIDVFGQDVPAGTTDFDAIVSSRTAPATPVPPTVPTEVPTVAPPTDAVQPPVGIGPALLFLLVVVGAVALLVLNATRGRARTAAVGVPGTARPRLVVRSGRLIGREFPLGAQGLTIGRGRDNDLQLEGNTVSRRHATIRSARGQFFLQDQGSTHGTYLNGRQIDAAPLGEGDVIRIGDVELEFRIH